jgi:hypothetical protein
MRFAYAQQNGASPHGANCISAVARLLEFSCGSCAVMKFTGEKTTNLKVIYG